MLAQPPRERRTGEGGVKLRRYATAPQAHRRGYGKSLCIGKQRQESRTLLGGHASQEEESKGAGDTYSETTVRNKERHRQQLPSSK